MWDRPRWSHVWRRHIGGVLAVCAVLACGWSAHAEPDEAGAGITVVVQDPDGRPYEGAQVWIGGVTATETPRPEETTNANGLARLAGVQPGTRGDLIVLPRDDDWNRYTDLVRRATSLGDMTVCLEPAYTVQGRVVDPTGAPVPHARIYLNPGTAGGSARQVTLSHADGSFVVHRLQAGTVRLAATIEWLDARQVRSMEVQVEVGAQDFVLPMKTTPAPREPVYYFWVYTANGRPVHAADGISRSGGPELGWCGESSGAFDTGFVSDLNVHAPLWMEWYVPRSRLGAPLPYGAAVSGPHGPGAVDVEVRLPPEKILTGRVLGPDGKGVGAVKIEARPWRKGFLGTGFEDKVVHATCTSGGDGSFRLGHLTQGPYRLKVEPPADYAPMDAVSVEAGTTNLEIPLRLGLKAKVRIRDAEGNLVPAATVRVGFARDVDLAMQDDSYFEHWRSFQADANGVAHLIGLWPDTAYSVVVQPPEDRVDVLGRRVAQWTPEDTEIQLPRAHAIQGTVQDPSGKPVPGAKIGYRAATGARQVPWWTRLQAAEDGTFRVDRLTAGTYTFTADPPDAAPPDSESRPGGEDSAVRVVRTKRPPKLTDIEAGTQDAVLVANMPTTLLVEVRDWNRKYGGATAVLAPEASTDSAVGDTREVGRDGTVTFDGLAWGETYVIWIGGVKGDLCFYERGVRVRDGDLTVRLETGRTLTGRIQNLPGIRSRKVWVQFPGFRVQGKLKAAGRFEIRGLPAGPWDVHATGRQGKATLHGTARVEEGDKPEIVLGPE